MSLKAPFPYFGGKSFAAPIIWEALGDPGGYVEPFCGSAAVLLERPPHVGRRVETLNDADGWLVNAWRSIQLSPDAVAEAAYGPVTEIDYHARLAWLQARRDADLVAWLEGDPEHHDAKAAGWWLYVMACGIGEPFGAGPWQVVDGHLRKVGSAGKGVNRKLPHLGDAGQGLAVYMRALAERLARVRITCGDWQRVLTPAASRATTGGDGSVAVLLDPSYNIGTADLYGPDTPGIERDVREWCASAPADLRIVLCGYHDQHDALLEHGWTKRTGKATKGGYGGVKGNSRERLWLSPACLTRQTRMEFV